MRKQELLHVHALLVEIADHVTDEGAVRAVADYAECGVRPTSLHRPKADHERAVMTLADGIVREVAEDPRRPAPVRH